MARSPRSSTNTGASRRADSDIEKRYPFLHDPDLSDDLKKHLISTVEAREGSRFNQSMERVKWRWNTPLVVALVALIGTAAQFVVGWIEASHDTQNTLTISEFNSRFEEKGTRLKAEIEAEAHAAEYKQQLEVQEAQFQYKIVERTLDQNLPERDRAEALLFWIKAGVLDKLEAAALEAMAKTSLDRTNGTMPEDGDPAIGVPQLSGPSARTDAASLRETPAAAMELIKNFESLQLLPHGSPSGWCVVGYGHLVASKPCESVTEVIAAAGWQDGITPAEAEQLLEIDTIPFRKAVQSQVSVELNDNQFGALVSFTFNVGTNGLRTSGILEKLNQGSYADAQWLLQQWKPRSGIELPETKQRRLCEASLFSGHNPVNAKGEFDRELCGVFDPRYGTQE